MDTNQLVQLLQATLDPNPNTRVQAELSLAEASRSSGTPCRGRSILRSLQRMVSLTDSICRDGARAGQDRHRATSRSSSAPSEFPSMLSTRRVCHVLTRVKSDLRWRCTVGKLCAQEIRQGALVSLLLPVQRAHRYISRSQSVLCPAVRSGVDQELVRVDQIASARGRVRRTIGPNSQDAPRMREFLLSLSIESVKPAAEKYLSTGQHRVLCGSTGLAG